MAAFSPQDLMSPMKKMEASLGEIKEATASIADIMTGSIQPNVALLSVIQTDISTIRDTLMAISKKLGAKSAKEKVSNKVAEVAGKTKGGIEMLGKLGEGVKSLAIGLILFKLVPQKTSQLVAFSINTIIESVEDLDKNTVKNATLLGDVGKSVFEFTKYMLFAVPLAPLVAMTMGIIAWEIVKFGMFLGSKELQEKVKIAIDVTNTLGEVGESILIFQGCMVLAGLLVIPATIAMTAIAGQIWLFSMLLGNSDMLKRIEIITKAVEPLAEVALQLLIFEGYMVLAGILAVIAIPMTLAIGGQIWLFSLLLGGKALKEKIDNATEAAEKLGGSGEAILNFEKSMFEAGVLAIPVLMYLPAILLTLVGTAFALNFIGDKSKEMQKGAVSLIKIGAGLIVFSIGLLVLGLAVQKLNWNGLAMAGAALVVVSGVAMALGIPPIDGWAKSGAINFILIGAGLVVFSIGMIALNIATKDLTWKQLGMAGAALGVISGVVIGLGAPYVKEFALFGSLVLMAISGALILFSKGLTAIRNLNWTTDDTKNLYNLITGVSSALLGINVEEKKGLWSNVKQAAKNTARWAAIGVASIGIATAGKALQTLSYGLKSIKNLEWDEEDTANFNTLIAGITTSFASIATETTVTMDDALKKIVVSFKVDPKAVEQGIKSVRGVSRALTRISRGITEFTNWYRANSKYLDLGNPNSAFYKALETTISGIGNAFAAVGEKGFAGGNKNAVRKGIKEVRGVGAALTGISMGITDFTKWYTKNKKLFDGKVDDKGKIIVGTEGGGEFFEALYMTVNSVALAFAGVAQGGADGGLWSPKDVKKGIKAVKDTQDALTSIVGGITEFTNWYQKNEGLFKDTKDSKGNTIPEQSGIFFGALDTTINSVSKAFANINNENRHPQWKARDVKKGIKAVTDVQVALTNIAEGLTTYMANSPKPEDTEKYLDVISNLGEVMSKYSKVNGRKAGSSFEKFSKNFTSGLNIIYKKKDTVTRMKNVRSLILVMERANRLKVYDQTAEGIKKIADAVNTIDTDKGKAFSNLFVAASKLKDNSKFYEDLKKAVEDIRKILEEQGNGRGEQQSAGNTTIGGNTPAANGPAANQANNQQNSKDSQKGQGKPNINLSGSTLKVDRLTISAEEVVVN